MDPKISTELLDKFFSGRCTPEEIAFVDKWIESFENDHDHLSGISEEEVLSVKNKIKDNILAKIGATSENIWPLPAKTEANMKWILTGWGRLAAASILLLFLLALYYRNEYQSAVLTNNDKEISFFNRTGGISKLTLPDRSQVWLNPHASITYPARFLNNYRLVKMDGACFFEVVKGAKWPFIVESRHIITKVWGTSFRIRDDADISYADVSVVTGKVSVSPNHGGYYKINKISKGEIMLYPDQKGTLPATGRQIAKQIQTRNEGMKIWDKMSLSFEKASVKKMIPLLEEQFKIKIVVNDPAILDEELNADFDNFNLADVLTVFEKTLEIKYTIVDNTVTLLR